MTSTTRPLRGLTNGPITPTLIRFSLPVLFTIILHAITGTWNAVWVSQVLGPNELIAVVNANVLLAILMGTVMGFGVAAGVFIGQSIGAQEFETARHVVGTSVTLAAGAGVAIAIIGFFGVHLIVDLLHMPDEARAQTMTFFRIVCLSMPTLFVFVFITMMIRNAGDSKTPFYFNLIWNGLGLVLSPLLLTGAFGFPRLGMAGTAYAGWIANAIALIAIVIYIYRKDMPLALRGADLRHLRPDFGLIWRLAKRGIPAAAETWIVQGSYFVLLSLVNAYGVVTAAGYAAAAQLWIYVQMPTGALAASMSAMAAQNIGAGQWDRVNKIALRGCGLGFTATAGMAILVYALGDIPLLLFLPDAGESLTVARSINEVVLWSWPIIALTFGIFSIVRANGVMLPSAIIFAITLWGLRVPFANMLQPALGSAAIWWSFPLGTFASAILAFAYYRWGRWREHAPLRSIVQ